VWKWIEELVVERDVCLIHFAESPSILSANGNIIQVQILHIALTPRNGGQSVGVCA
jgi:hypothetical protein